MLPKLPHGQQIEPLISRLAIGVLVLARGLDRGAARAAIGVSMQRAHPRAVVLLGHEWHGIPEEQVADADLCVEIPMVGQGASLNVAVAGSLVLYRLAGMI